MSPWTSAIFVAVVAMISLANGGPVMPKENTDSKVHEPHQPLKSVADLETVERNDDIEALIKCHKEYITACCEGDHFKSPMYIQTPKGFEKCSSYAECCKL